MYVTLCSVINTTALYMYIYNSHYQMYNNNNNNNKHKDIYTSAVIMAEPLREFTRFTR